ncbi:MAG TPA: VIT1/CCC1 transporter family protein [Patescibacteria group bacterium]|nr:VIT1/CCC1 transporter family protein [Patescibacteria group bacterium]
MKDSIKTGFSFGLTSGIITTLGLMVGLQSGTHSQLAVIGGILTIAVADAFSDALGIHVSEESENKHSSKEIWLATLATFFTKLFFASTFIIPVLIFDLPLAVLVSAIWGTVLLAIFSLKMAELEKTNRWRVVGEHLLVALIVIILAHYLGNWVALTFK